MKKIITFAGIAILFVLLSAPSFVKSAVYEVGICYVEYNGNRFISTIYQEDDSRTVTSVRFDSSGWVYSNNYAPLRYGYNNTTNVATRNTIISAYIPTLESSLIWSYGDIDRIITGDYDDYVESLPEELRPEPPSWSEQLWIDFLDFLEFQLGLDPFDGGIWNFFKRYFEDPENETLEIYFPTNTPTPTPTPRPTPIPVQTIYVPDGNGSYTIIYQYPDPSGTITQSPYNPNVDVTVDVDCDCDDGNDYNPTDPMYYSFDGLTWASVDGDLTGSPAMSAGQSLEAIKVEVDSYDEPIKVVSNSFGALPSKWLSLVGLLGACLIVAGLIRTFLGG